MLSGHTGEGLGPAERMEGLRGHRSGGNLAPEAAVFGYTKKKVLDWTSLSFFCSDISCRKVWFRYFLIGKFYVSPGYKYKPAIVSSISRLIQLSVHRHPLMSLSPTSSHLHA